MPVLKWARSTRKEFHMETVLFNGTSLSYSTYPATRAFLLSLPFVDLSKFEDRLAIENYVEFLLSEVKVVGEVTPSPGTDELLMEKMEELISKLYPDEYLKAVLEQTETGR